MRFTAITVALAVSKSTAAYLRGEVHDDLLRRNLATVTCGALAPTIKRTIMPAGPFSTGGAFQVKLTVNGAGGSPTTKPLDVVFSVDSSASMAANDPQELRLAAIDRFLAKLKPATDKAGVVSWNSQVIFKEPLSANLTYIKSKVDSIAANGSGKRSLNGGLEAAFAVLDADASARANKFIIFLTDGDGNYTAFFDGGPANAAKTKGYTIYAIGLGSAVSATNLRDFSSWTNGAYYPARNPSVLGGIFDTIYKAMELSTEPQHMTLIEVVQNYFTVAPASIKPVQMAGGVTPGTGETTIIWQIASLAAMNSTQNATFTYKVTVNSNAANGVKPFADGVKSGIQYKDFSYADCPFLKTPGPTVEIKDRCDTLGYYKIAGNPTPTSMVLPSPNTPDELLMDTSGESHTITSDDSSIAAKLGYGQTCYGDSAWYYNATGTKINVPDHILYTTQLLFMKSRVQDAQMADYTAMCNKTINLQTTCNNGLPTDVVCFKAVCPWL